MGKGKLIKLFVLFVLYFFLGFHSGADHRLYPGSCAELSSAGSAVQRPARRDNLRGDYVSEQGSQEELVLLTSSGQRYNNASIVTVPEGTKVAVANVQPNVNVTITIRLDGEQVPAARFELGIGVHIIEANGTAYRTRTVKVITQEAYQALQAEETEPAGLRLRAAIIASLGALLGMPFGALIKHRRARPSEL